MTSPIVTVFGSARVAEDTDEYRFARDLGKALAACGWTVCNGGYGGTMEAAARGAKEGGGSTIGIVADIFGDRTPNRWIDSVQVEHSLIDRLMRLVTLGDAYVVLKGGTGTLLELAVVWEFVNKGLMEEKPIVIAGGFWDPVVRTLSDELAWEGLEHCTGYVRSAATTAEVAEIIGGWFAERRRP